MAHDFDYAKNHARPFYAPKDFGTVRKGMVEFASSIEDEQRVRNMGYTSKSYVRSDFPTTRYHKITGEAKIVGALDRAPEKNQAELAALGPDWVDYPVEAPAPKPAANKEDSSGLMGGLLTLMTELQGLRLQMTEVGTTVEESADQLADVRAQLASLQARVGDLESEADQKKEVATPKPIRSAQAAARGKEPVVTEG